MISGEQKLREITKNKEREELKTKLLQKETVHTENPRKQTKNKASRGGQSIRVKTVPKSGVVDSPVEQEATSHEGWSQASAVLRTPDTSSDARAESSETKVGVSRPRPRLL